MNRLLRLFTLAAAALSLASGALAKVEVGKPAPDFTLTDTNGKTHSLADFKGKLVVLEWVNHGCPYVRKHYDSKNMQSLQAKYSAQGVVWLSICSSAPGQQGHMSPADWNKTNASNGFAGAALLIDEPGKVGRLYGARTTPHMYVIDATGTLVYQGGIDSIRSSNQADIAKAENYVAAALDAVMAGKPVANASTQPYGCSVKYAPDS
jgi:peroxiredoxin